MTGHREGKTRPRAQIILEVLAFVAFALGVSRATAYDIRLETSLLLWPFIFGLLANRSLSPHEGRLRLLRTACSAMAFLTALWLLSRTF